MGASFSRVIGALTATGPNHGVRPDYLLDPVLGVPMQREVLRRGGLADLAPYAAVITSESAAMMPRLMLPASSGKSRMGC